MGLKFRALEVPKKESDYDINIIGFNRIEVIQFNYDGKGSALVLENGEIGELSMDFVSFLLY